MNLNEKNIQELQNNYHDFIFLCLNENDEKLNFSELKKYCEETKNERIQKIINEITEEKKDMFYKYRIDHKTLQNDSKKILNDTINNYNSLYPYNKFRIFEEKYMSNYKLFQKSLCLKKESDNDILFYRTFRDDNLQLLKKHEINNQVNTLNKLLEKGIIKNSSECKELETFIELNLQNNLKFIKNKSGDKCSVLIIK